MSRKFILHFIILILINSISLNAIKAQATFFKYLSGNFLESYICTTMDDGYTIATKTSGAITLIRFNELGNITNTKTFIFQGSSPDVTSIIQTSDSGFVITAKTNQQSFIIKTTINLDSLWTKSLGIPGDQVRIGNVVELNDSSLVFFGCGHNQTIKEYSFLIKTNSIGDSLFTRTLRRTNSTSSIYQIQVRGIVTPDGGYLIQCDDYAAVFKTDSTGQIEWHYGTDISSASPLDFSFDCTTNGEYYIAYMAQLRLGIEKLDSSGTMIWRRELDLVSPMNITPVIKSNAWGGFAVLARTNDYPVLIIGDAAGNIVNSSRITDSSVLSITNYQNSDLQFTSDLGLACLMHLTSGNLGIKKYYNSLNICNTIPIAVSDTALYNMGSPLINVSNGYLPYQNFYDTILTASQNVTINVLCSNLGSAPNVWPGDCNYDLSVNNIDFLYLNIANSASGPVRPNSSTNWVPQPANNWTNNFISGANYKHADTNGDGTIDLADTLAINLNYNYSHPFRLEEHSLNSIQNNFHLDAEKDTVFPGDTAIFSININSDTGTIDSLYGIAWSIAFDTSIVDTGFIQLNYVPSVLGTLNSDLESFQKSFNSSGFVDLAVSRTDHNNAINLNGTVGQIKYKIKSNLTSTTLLNSLPFNVHAFTYYQNEIHFSLMGDSVVIYVSPNYLNEIFPFDKLDIYPNPKSFGIVDLNVKLPFVGKWKLEIFDMQGRNIKVLTLLENRINQTIPVKELPAGVYNVNFISDKFLGSKKLIIIP